MKLNEIYFKFKKDKETIRVGFFYLYENDFLDEIIQFGEKGWQFIGKIYRHEFYTMIQDDGQQVFQTVESCKSPHFKMVIKRFKAY